MPDEKDKKGAEAVVFSIESGTEIDAAEVEGAVARDEGIKGEAEKWSGHLLADCPVVCLGHDSGIYYYLSAARQFMKLPASLHKRLELGEPGADHRQ